MWTRPRIAMLPDRVAVSTGRGHVESLAPVAQADAMVRAFAEILAKSHLRGGVEVILSHVLAPVWLLRMPEIHLDWAETLGWAREQLTDQLGDRVNRYRLAFQPAPPGEPLLVAALDAEWLAAMTEALASQGVSVRAVMPWLAVAHERRLANLRRGSNWLALAEAGRLTLAFFENGRPRTVRSLQVNADMAGAMADAIRRETLLGGLPGSAPVWLESAGVHSDWQAAGLDIRQLNPGEDVARVLGGY